MPVEPALEPRPPRRYHDLLPEFFPVRLVGSFISVDFVVGGRLDGGFRGDGRHPARQALFDAGVALDNRVSPRRMLAWLRSMPSYRAGVQLRIGHDTHAALQFDKCAELLELLDPGRSVVYETRAPLSPEERAFFAAPRPSLLLKPTATPRSAALGVTLDPLELVHSAAGLDARALHWVVGPLADDGEAEALRILAALPRGSHLTLLPLGAGEGPARRGTAPLPAAALSRLEAAAHAHGLSVSDWFCRNGLARVGQGFFDVDRLTGQLDLARRAHDLITCAACPSRTQCHGPLDEPALLTRLARELGTVGLTPTAPPVRTGPRAYRVEVVQPASRGDEAYLSHALGQPAAIALTMRGRRPAGRGGDAEPAVLRRWFAAGFLPVTELNAAAEKLLEDLERRQAARGAARIAGLDGAC